MPDKTPVVDTDSHVLEPSAIWDEYLAPEYRVAARSAFLYRELDGITTIILNGKPVAPMNRSGINRQAVWRPGTEDREIAALDPSRHHPITPGAVDAAARIADMDAMGVEVAVVFPTLFAEYFPIVDNADVAAALARAYNDWVLDFCAADRRRLVPAAVLPLQDVGFAVEELRRVAAAGFTAVALRPAFQEGRFLAHDLFAPLWRELETSGLVAAIHPSTGATNPEWTSQGSYVERVTGRLGLGHSIAEAVAGDMDNAMTLTAFCFGGHLEDYPALKIHFAHSGASWVTLVLEKAETYLTIAASVRNLSLEPEHVFFRGPYLTGFDTGETSVARQADVFRDVACWGSRYPNHDASSPGEAAAHLEKWDVAEDVVAKWMGGNAARIYGLR